MTRSFGSNRVGDNMAEETITVNVNPHSYLTDPVEIFTAVSEPVPPGTMAPPRPPGKERLLMPATEQDQDQTGALVALIEAALQTIHAALAEIKRLQPPAPPQSKAG